MMNYELREELSAAGYAEDQVKVRVRLPEGFTAPPGGADIDLTVTGVEYQPGGNPDEFHGGTVWLNTKES